MGGRRFWGGHRSLPYEGNALVAPQTQSWQSDPSGIRNPASSAMRRKRSTALHPGAGCLLRHLAPPRARPLSVPRASERRLAWAAPAPAGRSLVGEGPVPSPGPVPSHRPQADRFINGTAGNPATRASANFLRMPLRSFTSPAVTTASRVVFSCGWQTAYINLARNQLRQEQVPRLLELPVSLL